LNKLDTARTTTTPLYHRLDIVGSQSIVSPLLVVVPLVVVPLVVVPLVVVPLVVVPLVVVLVVVGCRVDLWICTISQSGESAWCSLLQLTHLGFKCSQGVLELQVVHLWLVV
jgi:hypothetical protein